MSLVANSHLQNIHNPSDAPGFLMDFFWGLSFSYFPLPLTFGVFFNPLPMVVGCMIPVGKKSN